VIRQDRGCHRLAELHLADEPVAAAVLAVASGAGAQRELAQQHRETTLEHLRVSEARIRHVGLHATRPVEARTRSGAAGNRLVVLVARGAKREVVHRALGSGLQPERAVQRVDDALRGFDVAGNDRARWCRVEHRALRHPDVERAQAPCIQRDRFLDQRAENVQHRRNGDRARCVEIVRTLCRGAGEIDDRRTRIPVDRDADCDALAVVELVVEAAIVQPADRATHAGLAIVLDVSHVPEQRRPAVHRGGALDFADAASIRGELRAQVGDVLPGITRRPLDVGEHAAHLGLCEPVIADDPDRRNQHPFLGDVAAAGRHRSRRRAADVGVVRARRGEEMQALAGSVEHRRDDGHVGQMRAAVVR